MSTQNDHKFIKKAEKLLDWCRIYYKEMEENAHNWNFDEVERALVSVLNHIGSLHESLIDASKKIGENQWKDNLNELRQNDLLLRYFWQARNSETHDALIKWQPSMVQFPINIVNHINASEIAMPFSLNSYPGIFQIVCYVFDAKNMKDLCDKIKESKKPSIEKQKKAGVEFGNSLGTFVLKEFTYRKNGKNITVNEPSSHLGKILPPSANVTLEQALQFYTTKLDELKILARTK